MSLSRELAGFIDRYCQQKGKSLSSLSRQSGVPYGSVKRIAQGESIPEFYNTLKILMAAVPEPDECFGFIKKHYGDVGDFLARVNFNPGKRSLVEALSDKVSFYIIHWAVARGTNREEVAREYGRNGLETLESLLNQGILREVNQRIITDDFSVPNIQSLLEQIRFLLEDFDVNSLGNKKSMASLQIFGMNDKGIQKIYEAQKEFLAEIREIKDREEFNGEQAVFLATLFNSLRGAS